MAEVRINDGGRTVTIEVPIEISVRVGGARVVGEARAGAPAPREPARAEGAAGGLPESFVIDDAYEERKGYLKGFLGTPVPLPTLSDALMAEVSRDQTSDGANNHVLRYHNFSIVMSKKRRMAIYAACNTTRDRELKGQKSRTELGRDRWILDPRIPAAHQVQTRELYGPSIFDRGHLVRREDVYWSKDPEVAEYANFDSFHYTNCTPQHPEFNQSSKGEGLWGRLENHIAASADTDGEDISYFAGPIFGRKDRRMSGIVLPSEFFKIVLARRKDKTISAWAFRLSQRKLVAGAPEPEGVFDAGEFEPYLTSVEKIEELTGLTFDPVVHGGDVRRGGLDEAFGSFDEIPE